MCLLRPRFLPRHSTFNFLKARLALPQASRGGRRPLAQQCRATDASMAQHKHLQTRCGVPPQHGCRGTLRPPVRQLGTHPAGVVRPRTRAANMAYTMYIATNRSVCTTKENVRVKKAALANALTWCGQLGMPQLRTRMPKLGGETPKAAWLVIATNSSSMSKAWFTTHVFARDRVWENIAPVSRFGAGTSPTAENA